MHPAELTAAERLVRQAFARGQWADLGAGGSARPGPPLRAEVLAALLLAGAAEPADGAVPALRLRGATVTGRLDVSFASITVAVHLDGCTLDTAPELTGASARSLELTRCALPGLNGRLLGVEGDLRISDCMVSGCLALKNARVSGTLTVSGSQLVNPGGRALDGGGLVVGGGLVGRRGLRADGSVRLIGARVEGGVLLEGARLRNPGGAALCADELVTTRLQCSGGFEAEGEVQLRNARVSGEVSLHGSRLLAGGAGPGAGTPPGSAPGPPPGTGAGAKAVRARGMSAGELFCTPDTVDGMVDLSRARVGALRDTSASWPALLRLDGLTYDHLLAFDAVDARRRCDWLTRDAGTYRPQPYEQLAAYYRRLGHDGDARAVLLAKQRRRRATLRPVARLGGYLLDALVGYGYRSWRAAGWLVVLLATGTVVFSARPPLALDPAHRPHFHAFVYGLDLLIPIGAFGLRGAYDPQGWTRWVAYALVAAGWILATAVVAGVTRALRRD